VRYKNILLAAFSGILLFLIFPKFNCSILAWVALVPLLIAIEGEGPKVSFGLGLLAGFVSFLGILYWIAIFSIPGLVLLALYLALYIAFFCLLVNFAVKRTPGFPLMIVCVPSLWVSLEFLRTFIFSGFPWAALGCSQYLNIPLIQIASFSGVYGISFLIVLVNATIAYVILEVRGQKPEVRRVILPVGLVVLVIISCFVYGWLITSGSSLARTGHSAPSGGDLAESGTSGLKIAIIQGNIDLPEKWDPAYKDIVLNTYCRLSRKAAKKKPNLIVWPETTVASPLKHDPESLATILDLARSTKAYIIVGSLDWAYGEEYYNSAFLISPRGRIVQQYNKVHLVPFGERVPLRDRLPILARFVESRGGGGFVPGDELTIFDIGADRFGCLICFEGIFGILVQKFVKQGAQFVVNITNDAWYGRSAASYQHFTFSIFRAVENRVPVVRAASTGISAFIDRYGRIEEYEDIFVERVLVGDIILSKSKTFYTKFGDIFSWLCLTLSGTMMGLVLFRKR
jgi:apolipoprotein N-acyltransferase